ncbi:GGDEF domain-containing protein [Frankia sp. AgB1.9]|uniref:GGDEF domain-containing protein n=1 Tax=unclassified Frankia TaxID=2632575 RepID=UPI0019346B57|nr:MULTISPECIES: GGDEF domain-containing protein [unclassified Frankia]MBL7491884.1 GGDEF domain-containing protein [Frankia sp. AgW1.1]MBL7551960.1 GGDEF domain-containing protein [Frankia sp. AgB1.9]MBL7623270.1 GGDEF domain-containing protein [Frankia sp. AgB1.8]
MLACAAALLVAAAFLPSALLTGQRLLVVQGAAQVAAALGALAVGVVGVARTSGTDRRWRALVGTDLVVALVGALEWVRNGPFLHETSLGPAELLYLAPSLLVLAGLLWIPAEAEGTDTGRGPPTRLGERPRYSDIIVALDGLVIVASMLLIIWITTLSTIVSSGVRGWPFAVAMTFSLWGTLEVVVAILVGTFRRPRNGRSLTLLTLGLTMQIVPELAAVVLSLKRSPLTDASGPYWAFLAAGPPLVALALVVPDRRRGAVRTGKRDLAPSQTKWPPLAQTPFYLPYLPLAAAITLIVGLQASGTALGSTVLYLVFALAMAVTVRQLITVAQNVRLLAAVQAAHEQLRYQAFHDPLTGLPNRAHFTHALDGAVTDHRTDHRPLALMFCDLDDFKSVNDTLGHAAGDDLLKAVADRLSAAVRADDLVARLGGDEFAVLLTEPDQADDTRRADTAPVDIATTDTAGTDQANLDEPSVAAHRAEQRILTAMAPPFTIRGHRRPMRVSVGLAVVGADEPVEVADELLHRADCAMYAAKGAAKGRLAG